MIRYTREDLSDHVPGPGDRVKLNLAIVKKGEEPNVDAGWGLGTGTILGWQRTPEDDNTGAAFLVEFDNGTRLWFDSWLVEKA